MSSDRSYDERVTTVSFRCATDLKAELDAILDETDLTNREWLEAQIQETAVEFEAAVERGRELEADELEETFNRELQTRDHRIGELVDQIRELQAEIRQLRQQRNRLRMQVNDLEQQLAAKQANIEDVQEQAERRSRLLDEFGDDLLAQQEEVEALRDLLVDDLVKVGLTVDSFEEQIMEKAEEIYQVGRLDGTLQMANR